MLNPGQHVEEATLVQWYGPSLFLRYLEGHLLMKLFWLKKKQYFIKDNCIFRILLCVLCENY